MPRRRRGRDRGAAGGGHRRRTDPSCPGCGPTLPGDAEGAHLPIFNIVARLSGHVAPLVRGMTLGVRGCCLDAEGRVFLVRHSYMPGWYLPGGGVERRETAIDALKRELEEEGGIRLEAEPALFGVYFNRRRQRDHVLVFVSRAFSRPSPPAYPNREIAEAGFFLPAALPQDVSPATRRRLDEILAGATVDPLW